MFLFSMKIEQSLLFFSSIKVDFFCVFHLLHHVLTKEIFYKILSKLDSFPLCIWQIYLKCQNICIIYLHHLSSSIFPGKSSLWELSILKRSSFHKPRGVRFLKGKKVYCQAKMRLLIKKKKKKKNPTKLMGLLV